MMTLYYILVRSEERFQNDINEDTRFSMNFYCIKMYINRADNAANV